MIVYRLQHTDSGLGPFEHVVESKRYLDNPASCISTVRMQDVPREIERSIIKTFGKNVRYAWCDLQALDDMIISRRRKDLFRMGFIITSIEISKTLYEHYDGQIIFDIRDVTAQKFIDNGVGL